MVDKSKLIECKWNEGPEVCEFQGAMYQNGENGWPKFFIFSDRECWVSDNDGMTLIRVFLDRCDHSQILTFYKNKPKPEPIVFEAVLGNCIVTSAQYMFVPATVPHGNYKVTLERLP